MRGQAIVIFLFDPLKAYFGLLSKFRADREGMQIFTRDSLKRALFLGRVTLRTIALRSSSSLRIAESTNSSLLNKF
jgi:hypothetical protein